MLDKVVILKDVKCRQSKTREFSAAESEEETEYHKQEKKELYDFEYPRWVPNSKSPPTQHSPLPKPRPVPPPPPPPHLPFRRPSSPPSSSAPLPSTPGLMGDRQQQQQLAAILANWVTKSSTAQSRPPCSHIRMLYMGDLGPDGILAKTGGKLTGSEEIAPSAALDSCKDPGLNGSAAAESLL
ncbi:hypothetical protein AKJ16_DCAP10968, partial [Drosera capensis]